MSGARPRTRFSFRRRGGRGRSYQAGAVAFVGVTLFRSTTARTRAGSRARSGARARPGSGPGP